MIKRKKKIPERDTGRKRGGSRKLQVQTQKQIEPSIEGLLGRLRTLIQNARQQAMRSVDVVQVSTC